MARVEPEQIIAPLGAGEARIPALVALGDGRTVLFYDERPAPACGAGSDFNGLTMASDLPNPNRIRWVERQAAGRWSAPRPLPAGCPPVSSDACVGVDGGGWMHLAFASTRGCVGYMDSRAAGERLRAWWAWGSIPEELTYEDVTDRLYEETGADGLFAASGGTVSFGGAVALPYVVRTGDLTRVCVVFARGGELAWVSEPLEGPQGVLLDETTVSVWDGRLVANCRIQGFEGRGAGARYLAWGDGRRWDGGRMWDLEDPGCNARHIVDLFVHPHSRGARAGGAVLRLTPPWEGEVCARPVASLGEGGFGYSDAAVGAGQAVVVFERDRGLWEAAVPLPGA